MSFLQPALLWGLLVVSLPIIIHLLNRRRHRTVKWAAMDFLLKATRESRGKKKLKHILILTCRALAIAALIFAIARPLLGGFLGFGASVDTVVLILDRSASMERKEADGQPSKRELVLQQVADAMEELETARLVMIDSASGEMTEVPSPEVLPELSTTRATDTASDIPSLLATTLDYLREAQPGRTEIWLATDMQLANWRTDDSRWPAFAQTLRDLPFPTSLRVLSLPETPRENHSLRLLSVRRSETELTLELELTRDKSEGNLNLPITVNLNGAPTTDSLVLEGQSIRFRRTLPLPNAEATGWGRVSLPPDPNLRDNHVYFTYGEEQPLLTTLVHDGSLPEEARATLLRAVSPPGLASFQVQELELSGPSADPSALDLRQTALLLWAAPLPTDTAAVLVRSYLESGGQVLFLPNESDPEATFATFAWEPVESAPAGKFFIAGENWRRDEGPFRDGDDGTPLPLGQLRAIKRQPLSPASEAIPLATWDDGSPLLARRILGQGTAHLLTTLPDYTWSDLERTALHLVLTQRLLERGASRLDDNNRPAGQAPANNATVVNSALEGAPYPDSAGIYRLTDGEGTLLALNVPESELRIEQLTPEEIGESLLPEAPVSLFEQKSEGNQSLLQEFWRPFLLAMLLFLLAEALLTLNRKPMASPKSIKKATA
ncbi:BatA domain-containing protein [Roseibacillus ishigakijimensis]|uniref:BatA and WFA domain-containing protein n=1 Tax=Roseibacillus ishigakijimensis TaxID=454146 RepID=A0A934RPS4_9BACT|nr:BatA domain-containing protein [Roseibacillus ishigakijimensis]MBK1833607.1 BatA and WFA domain-containing protein [Roseibacillus ishigakijimensis]